MRTSSLWAPALGALLIAATPLAAEQEKPGKAQGGESAVHDGYNPANNTRPESQYNEKTPRLAQPTPPAVDETPFPENGSMDMDGSLSSDKPLDGRAPKATAPRSAPGRE